MKKTYFFILLLMVSIISTNTKADQLDQIDNIILDSMKANGRIDKKENNHNENTRLNNRKKTENHKTERKNTKNTEWKTINVNNYYAKVLFPSYWRIAEKKDRRIIATNNTNTSTFVLAVDRAYGKTPEQICMNSLRGDRSVNANIKDIRIIAHIPNKYFAVEGTVVFSDGAINAISVDVIFDQDYYVMGIVVGDITSGKEVMRTLQRWYK